MVSRFILNWFICLVFFLPAWGIAAWSELGGPLDLVVTAAFAAFFSLLLLVDGENHGHTH